MGEDRKKLAPSSGAQDKAPSPFSKVERRTQDELEILKDIIQSSSRLEKVVLDRLEEVRKRREGGRPKIPPPKPR